MKKVKMMHLDKVTTIDELRQIAHKRVPTMFYDYMESGSWTETTFRANCDDFKKISFRQRVAVDMSNRTTKTTMLGKEVAMPLAIAPTGLTGMQHADGEILAARAAADFGIPFTLSTMSISSIEDLATHTQAPFWFQLYVMKDHDFAKRLVNRAKAAECSALMLTLDLQILGQRHKDIKNGLTTPPKLTFKNIVGYGYSAALVSGDAGYAAPFLWQYCWPCGRGIGYDQTFFLGGRAI